MSTILFTVFIWQSRKFDIEFLEICPGSCWAKKYKILEEYNTLSLEKLDIFGISTRITLSIVYSSLFTIRLVL